MIKCQQLKWNSKIVRWAKGTEMSVDAAIGDGVQGAKVPETNVGDDARWAKDHDVSEDDE